MDWEAERRGTALPLSLLKKRGSNMQLLLVSLSQYISQLVLKENETLPQKMLGNQTVSNFKLHKITRIILDQTNTSCFAIVLKKKKTALEKKIKKTWPTNPIGLREAKA